MRDRWRFLAKWPLLWNGGVDPVDFARACDHYADKPRFGVYGVLRLRNEAKIEA